MLTLSPVAVGLKRIHKTQGVRINLICTSRTKRLYGAIFIQRLQQCFAYAQGEYFPQKCIFLVCPLFYIYTGSSQSRLLYPLCLKVTTADLLESKFMWLSLSGYFLFPDILYWIGYSFNRCSLTLESWNYLAFCMSLKMHPSHSLVLYVSCNLKYLSKVF